MRHVLTTVVLAALSLPLMVAAQGKPASPAPAETKNVPAVTAPANAPAPANKKVAAKRHHHAKKAKTPAQPSL